MIELNKDNFEQEVNIDGVVLVDYWSESCGRCMELMPDITKLAEEFGSQIKFCKLDIKGSRRLAMAQKVMGLPSIVFYKNGEKLEHLCGEELEVAEIASTIKNYL